MSPKISKKSTEPDDYDHDYWQKQIRSGRFKSGIYNECDRHCDECADIDRCLLVAMQEEMLNKYAPDLLPDFYQTRDNDTMTCTRIAPENLENTKAYMMHHYQVPDVDMKRNTAEIKVKIDRLFMTDCAIKDQKDIILILAHQGTEQALYALQKFKQSASEDLKLWCDLAIDECRMFLENN